METAYEFCISYAGEGVSRDAARSADQVADYVDQFEDALGRGLDAAQAVPSAHDSFDTDAYHAFVDDLATEVEEARTVLTLLGEQDGISSLMVDNLNGMAVFQSAMMKFFFLDELTTHLERSGAADGEDASENAETGDE